MQFDDTQFDDYPRQSTQRLDHTTSPALNQSQNVKDNVLYYLQLFFHLFHSLKKLNMNK